MAILLFVSFKNLSPFHAFLDSDSEFHNENNVFNETKMSHLYSILFFDLKFLL